MKILGSKQTVLIWQITREDSILTKHNDRAVNSENSLTDVMVAHPDSKLMCLAVHLLNEHCTTSEHTELYFIYFYAIIFNLFHFILNQHLNILK